MLQLVEQSTDLPIALDKVKAHLRIHSSDDGQDTYLTDLIFEAVDYIEGKTGFSYIESTFDLILPSFWTEPQRFSTYPQTPWPYWTQFTWPYPYGATSQPWIAHNRIYIPRPPLASVDSVKYHDTTNTQQTLDPSNYNVILGEFEPGFIEPALPNSWPSTYIRGDAVTVRFTTTVAPYQRAVFQRAVYLVCGWFNENREGQAKDVEAIDRLVMQLCDGGYR